MDGEIPNSEQTAKVLSPWLKSTQTRNSARDRRAGFPVPRMGSRSREGAWLRLAKMASENSAELCRIQAWLSLSASAPNKFRAFALEGTAK